MNFVEVPDGDLAVYSFGSGPPVIFLHGGPGDTHDYMKRMAETCDEPALTPAPPQNAFGVLLRSQCLSLPIFFEKASAHSTLRGGLFPATVKKSWAVRSTSRKRGSERICSASITSLSS